MLDERFVPFFVPLELNDFPFAIFGMIVPQGRWYLDIKASSTGSLCPFVKSPMMTPVMIVRKNPTTDRKK